MEPAEDTQWSAHGRRPLIALYLVAALLLWTSLYIYLPTLPTYAKTKTDSLAVVGVILAQYGLWQAVVRLPVGIAADWLGRRKPFIIAGMLLAGLGAWVMGIASNAGILAMGRGITGLGAATWVPLLVAFTSLFPAHDAVRATALLSAAASVGWVTATSATGALNGLGGYYLTFFVAAALAGLAALLMLPARERVYAPRRPSLGGIGGLITRPDVLLPSLLAAVVEYVAWAVTFGFMPILADRLGATGMTQSALMSLYLGLMALGSFTAAAVVRRIGAVRLVYATVLLMALGMTTAALAPSLAIVFLAQLFLGVGRGLSYPVLMGLSIQEVDDAQRTTAMGLHQSVYAIGMFAGPWLSGIVADAVGLRPMLGITAVACLVASLILTRRLPQGRTGSS